MVLWRLCPPSSVEDARDAFSGEGPCTEPKRWSHAGTRVVYCARSAAVALLEVLVELDGEDTPRELVAFRAELSDDVRVDTIDAAALPPDWRATPAPPALRDVGTAWTRKRSSALLVVPCSIVPTEENVLVNPEHPDFARVAISGPEPFPVDVRLRRRA